MTKSKYLLSPILILMCFLNQYRSEYRKNFGTHEMIAKVIKVDTVFLTDTEYVKRSVIPAENFKALCVRFEILEKVKGDFKGTPEFILIELTKSEHNCGFDFKEKETYKIYANLVRYSSTSVKKEYRKRFFRLDCTSLPEKL